MPTNEDSLARLVNRQAILIKELRTSRWKILMAAKTMIELVDHNLPNEFLNAGECTDFNFIKAELQKDKI